MKWSMFNFYVSDDDYLIIRNTLTTATMRISKKCKEEIDNLLSHSDIFKFKDPTNIERIVKKLWDRGIVDSIIDEKKQYKELFLQHREDDKTFAVYI
jgi:hypothetical protein